MIHLAIWAGSRRVGTLAHDATGNLFDFRYAGEWLERRDAFPLSPQLPMTGGQLQDLAPAQRSAIVRAFFQNLLPEGQALEVAAQINGLSRGNLAGLLIALGGETTGALRVTVADAPPQTAADPPLRPLSFAELSERIRQRPQMPFAVWDGKVRLSIAGLQDKIAVFEGEAGQFFLANGSALSSTVILKPAPPDARFADLPAVEHVCMQLAAAVGIPTAQTRLLHVPEPVLLVQRFDRRRAGDRVERLHIVDACQALGLAPELKYERPYGDQDAVKHLRDGASLARLFGLAELSPSPLVTRTHLLDRVIFNVLIGNSDAHGKNWSFFVGPQAGLLTLAPAYDLVDVDAVATEHMSTSFAMAIGDAFRPQELTPFEWASMASQCNVAPRHLATRIKALASKLPRALEEAQAGLERQGISAELLASFGARLQRRCSAVAAQAAIIAKVPTRLL